MARKEVDPLGPLIDRYFLLRNKDDAARLKRVTIPLVERGRPGGRLSPSNTGGCQRAAVFKFTGMEGIKRTDPQGESIFDDGNWRHHRWQANFRDMQRVLGRERFRVLGIEERIQIDDLYIVGHLDVTVWIRGFGKLVIDIKGINDRGFTRVLTEDKPIDKHVDQLLPYMEARGVTKGLLFYENKNDQRWRIYMVGWDDTRWQAIHDWADGVLTALEQERLPRRDVECQAGTYMEDRCPYAKWCFGEKSHAQLQQITFKDFPGVQASWEAGLEAEHERTER